MIPALVIEGGGIRGLVEALVIDELEQLTGSPSYELFPVLGGNSTGGIIGCGLSVGLPAMDLADLYRILGSKIFARSLWNRLTNPSGLRAPRYDPENLESVLQETLGTTTLLDARSHLVVPAYDGHSGTPLVFDSQEVKNGNAPNYFLWQVARATSAAQTYFPPFRLGRRSLVDGGLTDNSPAQCVEAVVRSRFPGTQPLIVAIGAGSEVPRWNHEDARSWGALQWFPRLTGQAITGDMVSDYRHLRSRLGQEAVLRFNPSLPGISLDDASKRSIAKIEAAARNLISESRVQLRRLADTLSALRANRERKP